MNIFFDVDGTIVGEYDGSLRPGVVEIFNQLRADGHTIYIWSGVGLRWHEIDQYNLRPLIETCFHKPRYDHHTRMVELGVTVLPDFVIDDHVEVVRAFGGITIKPYYVADKRDRDLERVYAAIVAHAEKTGPTPHPLVPQAGEGE
jgi:hypothetical protein